MCIGDPMQIGSKKLKNLEMVGFVCLLDSIILVIACCMTGELYDLNAVFEVPKLAFLVVLSAFIKQISALFYQRAVQVYPWVKIRVLRTPQRSVIYPTYDSTVLTYKNTNWLHAVTGGSYTPASGQLRIKLAFLQQT